MPVTGLLTGARGFGMFAAGPASDFALIASQTVGSGGASSVTFSNIPQGFRHLQVRGVMRTTESVVETFCSVRFNGVSGTSYSSHLLYGNGASALALAYASQAQMTQLIIAPGDLAPSSVFSAAVMDVLDYAITSKNTTVRVLTGLDRNGAGQIRLTSGAFYSTDAITSLSVIPTSGSLVQHSTFSLYGVR